VCVGITSFNVPLLLLAAKCAPALATGNTFIVKPSERNCLSTMYIGRLFKEAGFPPGVFNCVIGEGNTGRLLSEHPDVNKVPAPLPSPLFMLTR
jgi:aldehyde dehydrogenase (NAD+)